MTEKNKIRAERLTDIICATGYVAEHNPHLSGAKDACKYESEFMREVYWKLIDFNENVKFLTLAKFKKLIHAKGTLIFNGKFVKVFRRPDYFSNIYYVYCASTSKLGTCYLKAKESNFKDY